jgi:hypothetical protein
MKIILASLMCFVLGASQCFAIKGGPWGGGGSTSLLGNFAGVMEGELGSNGLGIFTINVPQNGLATGVFLIFQSGLFLMGDIQALADGHRKKITGLLHAEATRTEVHAGTVTTTIVAIADGQMRVNVSAGSGFTFGATLTGTAVVNEHGPDDPISDPANDQTYQVTGFQQSATPSG